MKRMLIGTALAITGAILVIPGIFLQGYFLRSMRAGAAGETVPPAFDDWMDMFVDGLKVALVTIVWVGLPVLLLNVVLPIVLTFVIGIGSVGAGAVGAGAGAGSSGGLPVAVGALVGGLGLVLIVVFVLGFVLTLALSYFLPAAIVGLATQDRLGAAFQLGAIWNVASTKEYLVGMLILVVAFTVLNVVAALLSILIVGFALQFYLLVAYGHFIGQFVARAAPDPEHPRENPASTVAGSVA